MLHRVLDEAIIQQIRRGNLRRSEGSITLSKSDSLEGRWDPHEPA